MPSLYRHILTAILIWVAGLTPLAHSEPRLLSIDDVLGAEKLGNAVIDHAGKWLYFEKFRPYDQNTDYSFGSRAYGQIGSQIWRYELGGDGGVELLPGLAQENSTFLEGLSPSGRFLLVMQYQQGRMSISAVDLLSNKSMTFPQTPAFDGTGDFSPVWISDTEFVLSALPDNRQFSRPNMRPVTAHSLEQMWQSAWKGGVSATEVRTRNRSKSDIFEDGQLVRANAESGQYKLLSKRLYADLRVAPDGRRLAALAITQPRVTVLDEEDVNIQRAYRLTLFDLFTGDQRMLASDQTFSPYSITWSADGRKLAAFGWTDRGSAAHGRFTEFDTLSHHSVEYIHRELDLASERERGYRQRPERAVFLADGLAVFARRTPHSDDDEALFSPKDVRPSDLSRADWFYLLPNGQSENLTRALRDVSPIPINADAESMTITAAGGAYRVVADQAPTRLTPATSGSVRWIRPHGFSTREGFIRPKFSDEALLEFQEETSAKLIMLNLKAEEDRLDVLVLNAPAPGFQPITGSLKAGMIFGVNSQGIGAKGQLLLARSKGQTADVASANSDLSDVYVGDWNVVNYSLVDPEGLQAPQQVEACVLIPPEVSRAEPPPLIVDLYPNDRPSCGPRPQQSVSLGIFEPHLWAAHGFAYARLPAPREFIQTAEGPIAGFDEVVDAGVDAIVANGLADRNDVNLFGFSQGGISALYVASKSDRYRRVIAVNSWTNLYSHFFGSAGIMTGVESDVFGDFSRYEASKGTDFGMKRSPWDDPLSYIENSPVHLARDIEASVMLIHSDMDAFSLSQFDEMYGALLRGAKDARYVRYWGEGHGPSSPANIRDMWRRMIDFLES